MTTFIVLIICALVWTLWTSACNDSAADHFFARFFLNFLFLGFLTIILHFVIKYW